MSTIPISRPSPNVPSSPRPIYSHLTRPSNIISPRNSATTTALNPRATPHPHPLPLRLPANHDLTRPKIHTPFTADTTDCLCLTPHLKTALSLNDPLPFDEKNRNKSSNKSETASSSTSLSTESSESIKTQSALNGGFFGAGRNWVQASVVKPKIDETQSQSRSQLEIRSRGLSHDSEIGIGIGGYDVWSDGRNSVGSSPRSNDEYHLVSMSEDLIQDKMEIRREHSNLQELYNSPFPEFKPRNSITSPVIQNPNITSDSNSNTNTNTPLDPSQFTSAQIAALAVALSPNYSNSSGYSSDGSLLLSSSNQPSHIANLVAQSTRLAQGLAHPPANRGFRPKASDLMDKNGKDENNTTVFVGGLSQGVSESILHDLFQPFGSVAYVKIPPGKGCGFVQFYSKHDAEYAIKQMQGFEVLGCSLRTHWGRSQTDRSGPIGATPEQVSSQVVSVCTAFGVPKEHTELVLRVLQACQAGQTGGV